VEPADDEHDVDALRAEIERLRADLDGAVDAARASERDAGRLRGQIAEMQVQLVRARQDQERYQFLFDRYRAVRERAARAKRRLRPGR
jgi:multidrug resistance efflux pump